MPTSRWEEEARVDRVTAARRAELGMSVAELARGVELDRMASTLLGERRLIVFRELAVLPRELGEDEQVLDAAYAQLFFGGGLLVLTDQRMMFINHRLVLPGVSVKRFELDSIRDHSLVMAKDFGRLTVRFTSTGWNADRVFDRIKPSERATAIDAKLADLLTQRRSSTSGPPATH